MMIFRKYYYLRDKLVMVERPNNVKILALNWQAISGFVIVWSILLLQDIIEHNKFL